MGKIREKGKRREKNTDHPKNCEIRVNAGGNQSEGGPIKGPYVKFEWARKDGKGPLMLNKKRLSRKEVFQQLLSSV